VNCSTNNRLLLLPAILLLSAVLSVPAAGAARSLPGRLVSDLTASGGNELRLARGYDMTDSIARPWDYLVNSSDLRLGIRGIYTKLRFDIEEPGMGFNPPEPVHREYLSRRTLGFENNLLTIEAGHVATQFGRGLTLSLKEDREVELYSILDGVYGQVRHRLVTFQAIAGRPYQWRNEPVLLVGRNSRNDTLLTQNTTNLQMRDMVAGVNAELFAPAENSPIPLLSSGSIGGGIVRYATGVGPQLLGYHDPVELKDPFWYRNRKEFFLPSLSGNFIAGVVGVSAEHAWMTAVEHRYTTTGDTLPGRAFDAVETSPPGMASYVSATAGLSAVTLTAEYKNYFYAREKSFSQEIAPFLIPPSTRRLHSWHLLSKQQYSNLMDDVIGYDLSVNWPAGEATLLTADVSFGGRHRENSRIGIAPATRYWEAYAEWAQEINDKLNIRTGFDWGRLDPDLQRVTYRTLACDIEAGPFAKRHSFGLILEGQLNDKLFYAENDVQALKALIARTLPADLLVPIVNETTGEVLRDTLDLDPLVADSARSRHTQYALNLLATISYGFSPWVSIAVTLEHETGFDNDNVHIVSEIASPKRNYASIGISVRPTDNHNITVEYGSMSGGKKCSLGTCVDLPPFTGLKVMVTSTF
jgi:hypothetical protein